MDNHVITIEISEKHPAGINATPYISVKTPLSEKCKSVKFDEYKLLDRKTDRVAEVMDKMNTRPLCK